MPIPSAFNPLATLRALGSQSGIQSAFPQQQQQRQPRQQSFRPQSMEKSLAEMYPEDEQEGLLTKIGYGLISGLGMVANVLDTPGSAVRAILAGKNPLPGIFDTSERVYGRDVLTHWGATEENDPEAWEMADFLGFAFDVGTDPLTWVSGPMGAFTKQGIAKNLHKGGEMISKVKGAKAHGIAGHLSSPFKSLQEIKQGDRALGAIKIPFTKEPLMTFGSGPAAAKVAEYLTYSAPINRMRQLTGMIRGAKYAGKGADMKAIDRGYSTLIDSTSELVNRHYQNEMLMPGITDGWTRFLKQYFKNNPEELEQALGTLRTRPRVTSAGLKKAGLLDNTGQIRSGLTEDQILGSVTPGTTADAIEELDGEDILRALIENKKYQLPKVEVQPITRGMPAAEKAAAKKANEAAQLARDNLVKQVGETSSLRGILKADKVDELSAELSRKGDGLVTSGDIYDVAQAYDDYAVEVGNFIDDARGMAADVGLPEPMMKDLLIGHYPRSVDEIWKPLFKARQPSKKLFGMTSPTGLAAYFNRARRDFLKDIPGGTRAVNAMSRDPMISARTLFTEGKGGKFAPEIPWKDVPLEDKISRAEYIQKHYEYPLRSARVQDMDSPYQTAQPLSNEEVFRTLDQIENIPGAKWKQWQQDFVDDHKQMNDLLGWLHEMPVRDEAERLKMYDLGIFSRDVMADGLNYARQAAKAHSTIETALEIVAQGATEENIGPSIWKVLTHPSKDGGLGLTEKAAKKVSLRMGELGKKLTDPKQMYLPEDAFPSLRKVVQLQIDDDLADKAFHWLDQSHAAFKAGVTIPFIAFHTRNRISGIWQNMVSAFDITKPHRIGEAMMGARGALRGKEVLIPSYVKDYGGEDILKLAKRFRAIDDMDMRLPTMTEGAIGKGLEASHLSEAAFNPFGKLARKRQGEAIAAADIELQAAEGLGKIGPFTKKHTRRVMTTGEDTMRWVESQNRLEHFYARILDGWTPAAAAESVVKNHFRYSDLAYTHAFQSKFLRRSFSFYPWLRFNSARQFVDLVNSPGGRTAQTVRAFDTMSKGDPEGTFVPPWLRERITVPINESFSKIPILGKLIGPAEDKTQQRYLTLSGFIPVEDALNKFPFLAVPGEIPAPQWKRIFQKYASMTRPGAQMVMEEISGKQLWTGRDKSQLFQSPTRFERVNDLLAHSPISRLLSTARTVMPTGFGESLEESAGIRLYDPRKGIGEKAVNLMIGGVNITDLDKERGLTVEGRRLLEDVMSPVNEVRTFSRMTVRPEDIDKLSEKDLRLWSLYNYLLARSRKAMRAEKK